MPFCAGQIVYSNEWLSQTSAISSTSILSLSAGYEVAVIVEQLL